MPEITYRNMPTDQVRRMPDNVYQGNINLTNLPANPRPQYTGLVDPALAASPIDPSVLLRDGLAGSQLVEDPRSWSSLGNRVAGTAAGLLLGKAAGAALSPKLIGSLAASVVGGLPVPDKGGGGLGARLARLRDTPNVVTGETKVVTGEPTARDILNREEAAIVASETVPEKIIPETEAQIVPETVPQTKAELEYELLHGRPKVVPLPNSTNAPTSPPSAAKIDTRTPAQIQKDWNTGKTDANIKTAGTSESQDLEAYYKQKRNNEVVPETVPDDIDISGVKASTLNVDQADSALNKGETEARTDKQTGKTDANIKTAGKSESNVRMSLPQIKDLATKDSYFREFLKTIDDNTASNPVKQKLFMDHRAGIVDPPKAEGGKFARIDETNERNKQLSSDINNLDLFRNYFKALSPDDPLFKNGHLSKTENDGQVFFEITPERKKNKNIVNPVRNAQLSGDLIIRRLKREFPDATTGSGGDLNSYNKNYNQALADARIKNQEAIDSTPKSRTIQSIQTNNPPGATILRYNVPAINMTLGQQTNAINRQHHVRFNGDPELYLVSPKRLAPDAKKVNHDIGTGDSLVHPPGNLNISGTRQSWGLGKTMHEKSKALDPNTPNESVTWETMDGQTHTKHLLKMTRDDTNEFVEHYNRKVGPKTRFGQNIEGYTQIFGLGGAAAGAALMAPPDTRRAPERY